MDINNLPEQLNTPEIKQAFSVLEKFSENQKNYLLYQSRLDAQREIETWKDLIEQERKEKEHLLQLLKKAGIDPAQET